MSVKPVIIIGGPTAVGKTKCAIDLAKRFGGEIVSADSMQIYKWMDIGSAKATAEEQAAVPHHLIDFVDPRETFTVSDYKKAAEAALDDIHSRGLIPVVVGGTGLYINALMYDMDFAGVASNAGENAYRNQLQELARTEGVQVVHDRLRALDPSAADRIHPNNVKRVIRAIEVAEKGDGNVQDFKTALKPNPKYDIYVIGLTDDRAALYDRINQRVYQMLEAGLLEEIEHLKKIGLNDSFTSMKGIGYKEFFPYLAGEKSLEETIESVQQNSRRYAKRQLTWFRRYEQLRWYSLSDFEDWDTLIEMIEKNIRDYFKF